MSRRYIKFDSIVSCGDCGWPTRFGSGFWRRSKPWRDGLNQTHPSTLKVVCYRCHRKHGGNHCDPRIREQVVIETGE